MAARKQYILEILLGANETSSFQGNINKAKKEIVSVSDTAKRTSADYEGSIKKLKKEWSTLPYSMQQTSARHKKSIGSMRQDMSKMSSSAKRFAGVVAGAFAAINVKDMAMDAMGKYEDFEQELAGAAATAKASVPEYQMMEKASRDAGKGTIKTAQESASALGYMALAGWNVNESTQALMPVLKESAATKMDLAETSDLVTDSMSALKLKVKDLPGYLDMITTANNSANTTSGQLMRAFIKTGGAARALKMDAQETGTALGILANNGTKSEESGRTMNSILTRLASNTEAMKAMGALKIDIWDSKGDFVGFEEALKRINKGISGLSMEDKAFYLKKIAGTDYYSKMIYLLDSVKKGAKGTKSAWDDLESKLANSEGSLDDMYHKMTNTVSGAKETMYSALDDAKISFGDAFKGEYIEILNDMGGGFNTLSENISSFAEENEIAIHQTYESIKDDVLDVGEAIGDAGKFVVDNFDAIESGVIAVGGALVTHKVAGGIKDIAKSVSGFVSSASKFNWIVLGATIAGTAITGMVTYIRKAHEKAIKAGLDEDFGDISLSLEDLDEIAREIVGKKSLIKISTMLESIGETEESIKSMTDSLSTVNKVSWKLKAGFEIDKDDSETYKISVKNYIKDAQAVIDSQGYTVSVATRLLLGSGSKIGHENDAFFRQLDTQVNRLKNKLNKKLEKALEDGIIDIKEDKAIHKLLKKIDKITTGVTEAQNKAKYDTLKLKYSGKDLTADNMKQLISDMQEYQEEVSEGALEAYETSEATLNYRLKTGDISKKKYRKDKRSLEEGYHKTKAKAMTRSSKYIIDTIMETYPQVGESMRKMDKELDINLKDIMQEGAPAELGAQKLGDVIDLSRFSASLDDETGEKIKSLLDAGAVDLFSEMGEYAEELKRTNTKVPQSLNEMLTTVMELNAVNPEMENSQDSLYKWLGKKIGKNQDYSVLVGTWNQLRSGIPESLIEEISEDSDIELGITHMLSMMGGGYDRKLITPISAGTASDALEDVSSAMQKIRNMTEISVSTPIDVKKQKKVFFPFAENTQEENMKEHEKKLTEQSEKGMKKLSSVAHDGGSDYPKAFAKGLNSKKSDAVDAANSMMDEILNAMQGRSFETSFTFNALVNPQSAAVSVTQGSQKVRNPFLLNIDTNEPDKDKRSSKRKGKKLGRRAKGGIVTHPLLTTFAEEGPEAAVPLDGSTRAKAIWRYAGEILGMVPEEDNALYQTRNTSVKRENELQQFMYSDALSQRKNRGMHMSLSQILPSLERDRQLYESLKTVTSLVGGISESNTAPIHIVYSPKIEVKGNADEKVIAKAEEMSQLKFEEMLERYMRSKKRVAF